MQNAQSNYTNNVTCPLDIFKKRSVFKIVRKHFSDNRILINVQVQGQYPQQWAPFQVTGCEKNAEWEKTRSERQCVFRM